MRRCWPSADRPKRRLQPRAGHLGDDAAISESVTALLAESYTVEVIGGETRLETAAQISELPFESATVTPETSSVIVANAGDANLVDALSAAAIGAASDTAFLADQDTCLTALDLAGGTEALSDTIEQQAREAASTDCDDDDDGVPSGLFGVTGGPTPEVVQFGDDGSETRTPIVNIPAGLEV